MAGPQFFTPQRKRPAPSQPVRKFTLEQANKTLPLVKRIVRSVTAAHAKLAASAALRALTAEQARHELARTANFEIQKLADLLKKEIEMHDPGAEIAVAAASPAALAVFLTSASSFLS